MYFQAFHTCQWIESDNRIFYFCLIYSCIVTPLIYITYIGWFLIDMTLSLEMFRFISASFVPLCIFNQIGRTVQMHQISIPLCLTSSWKPDWNYICTIEVIFSNWIWIFNKMFFEKSLGSYPNTLKDLRLFIYFFGQWNMNHLLFRSISIRTHILVTVSIQKHFYSKS